MDSGAYYQIGAGVGVLLPAELVEAANLRIGNSLEVELLLGKIMLARIRWRPLTLEELVAEHPSDFDRNEAARAWEQGPPVGKEII